MDQFLHVLVLFFTTLIYTGTNFTIENVFNDQILILSIALLLVTQVSAIVIKVIITQWSPESKNENDDSLAKAGRYIGVLERLFVFVFVVTNHWEAIGFLLAAKSVFRFGDLTSSTALSSLSFSFLSDPPDFDIQTSNEIQFIIC